MKYRPHNYQQYAADFILDHPVCCLMLDMGLGKTVITLSALWELALDRFDIGRILVIAPKRVATAVLVRFPQILKSLRLTVIAFSHIIHVVLRLFHVSMNQFHHFVLIHNVHRELLHHLRDFTRVLLHISTVHQPINRDFTASSSRSSDLYNHSRTKQSTNFDLNTLREKAFALRFGH